MIFKRYKLYMDLFYKYFINLNSNFQYNLLLFISIINMIFQNNWINKIYLNIS